MSERLWQLGELLQTTAAFLGSKGSLSPRLDAELLLAEVLGCTKVQLYVNFERQMSPAELDSYRELVRRRARHEPVAYILQRREFYGLMLKSTPAALIPRPETEHLVDAAREAAQRLWPSESPLAVADIGCGSGAIGLALAKNLPAAEIAAVDISPDALALARENAESLGLADQISFFQGDLLEPLAGRDFHLICANLPYIPSEEMAGLMPDVGLHEPHLALDGGPEGLSLIARLIKDAPAQLKPEGRLLLEIWPSCLPRLTQIAAEASLTVEDSIRDLAGFQRVAIIRRASV